MKALPCALRPAWIVGMIALLTLPVGCAVDGGYGYSPAVSVGVGLDYYEPFGFDYGGWGRGYDVGPPRGGEPHRGVAPARGFRLAPQGRAMPSIPSAPRASRARPAAGSRR